MATPRIPVNKKESLADMVARYKILAEPKTVNTGMLLFTLNEDLKLYDMLVSDSKHPKDTGLLKESWVKPAERGGKYSDSKIYDMINLLTTPGFQQYKGSFASGKFNVYVLNTATVGEQARRKSGLHLRKKKKLSGRHNLKRYMPFVDKRTQFYTKKLRIVRQQIDSDWKKFVPEYLHKIAGVM